MRAIAEFSRCAAAVIAVAASLAAAPAVANDFYAGKTIEFIVGGNVGGGHDVYARTLARHLPKYIPGSPTILVKNMPGAGSARAASFLYAVAPKDGTVIAALYPGAIMVPLLEDNAQGLFDPTKFHYLASAENGTRVCATFERSKIKTFAQAIAQKTVLGASAPGGSTHDYAHMHKKTADANFHIVAGYKATLDLALDMERGEIDGMCGWDWSTAKAQKPDWLRDNKVHILVQVNMEPDAELTKLGVPDVWQFVKREEDRKAVALVVSQQVFARPYVAPPGTPSERVTILRRAFDAAMQDKTLLAEAAKARIDISPYAGVKIQKLVESIYTSPKATVERAKAIIKP
jgi:tripartite-type tricarboxylate transporter receptor subunit TctC